MCVRPPMLGEIIGNRIYSKIWANIFANELPVNPGKIANIYGIKIVKSQLPTNVSGALYKIRGDDPVIIIEEADSNTRKKFAVAKALGHYFFRMESGEDMETYEDIDLRDTNPDIEKDKNKIFADDFAIALLMPNDPFWMYSKTYTRSQLSMIFGVSAEVLNYKFKGMKHRNFYFSRSSCE